MTGLRRALTRALRSRRHAGGSLRCPACAHAVRRFEPLASHWTEMWRRSGFDLDPRRFETLNLEAYACPLCGAADRERLYALWLDRIGGGLGPRGRVVEFAPCSALRPAIRRALPGWEHRTADLMMPEVDDRVDVCNMGGIYPDAGFDLFLCSHVLEHVADDEAALAELHRILKPGGRGLLMVPLHLDLSGTRTVDPAAGPEERWRVVGQDDHVRLHGRADFAERIERAGFRLERLGKDEFGGDTLRRHGIGPASTLYIGHKHPARCGAFVKPDKMARSS